MQAVVQKLSAALASGDEQLSEVEQRLVGSATHCLLVAERVAGCDSDSVATALRLSDAFAAALKSCEDESAQPRLLALAALFEQWAGGADANGEGACSAESSAAPGESELAAQTLRTSMLQHGESVKQMLQEEHDALTAALQQRLGARRQGKRRMLWWFLAPLVPLAASAGAIYWRGELIAMGW